MGSFAASLSFTCCFSTAASTKHTLHAHTLRFSIEIFIAPTTLLRLKLKPQIVIFCTQDVIITSKQFFTFHSQHCWSQYSLIDDITHQYIPRMPLQDALDVFVYQWWPVNVTYVYIYLSFIYAGRDNCGQVRQREWLHRLWMYVVYLPANAASKLAAVIEVVCFSISLLRGQRYISPPPEPHKYKIKSKKAGRRKDVVLLNWPLQRTACMQNLTAR